MKDVCLILIAHGSRSPQWREPFENLIEELKGDFGKDRVYIAYMQLASPTLEESLINVSSKGFKNIKILPLFMAMGEHARKDIPEQIKEISLKIKNLNIQLMPPIGEDPEFFKLIKEIIKKKL